jgi:hypothetical protein
MHPTVFPAAVLAHEDALLRIMYNKLATVGWCQDAHVAAELHYVLHPPPQGDRQAIKAQASADQAWYERQQASRAKLLQEQKLAAEREQRRARTAASECEHRNRVLEAELALADRKRELELQNTKEEQEAGRLMDQVGGEGCCWSECVPVQAGA